MARRHLFVVVVTTAIAVWPRCTRAQAAYLPEDNLAYPVQVIVADGGGTGFFVRHGTALFLVTAKHVLFDLATGQLRATEFTLRAPSKNIKESAVTVIHGNAGQLEEEHQIRADDARDVGVVRVGALHPDRLDTTPGIIISEKSRAGIIVAPFEYLTRYSDVDISSQIFMFGYPSVGISGFLQIDSGRPLVRGGIVAGLNPTLKTIIIDAPVNHGNSGGPVVQLSRTNRLRIIGIATQFVPVPEDVVGQKPGDSTMVALGNSGYGVVASADAIIDLISNF